MGSYLRAIRNQIHPLHQLRRSALGRAALRVCDVRLWVKLPGIQWQIRVRALRHASAFMLNGGVEPEISALLRALAQRVPIRSFWDIGANFGYYSWTIKSLLPIVDIRIFEPDPDNANLIRDTAKRSALTGITIRALAVSDKPGREKFIRDEVSGLTGGIDGNQSTFSETQWGIRGSDMFVDAVSIDEERIATDQLDLIKIDVEGHEEAVFRGAITTIQNDQPILIFECFHGAKEIREFLSGLGYWVGDVERMTDNLAAATNFLGLPHRLRPQLEQIMSDWSVELMRSGEVEMRNNRRD